MLQSRKWLALSFAPILPLAGFIVALRTNTAFAASIQAVHDLPLYITLVVVLIMAWVFYTSLKWWKAADEAVKEAHKWAWFWGGLVGLCAVVMPLILSYGLTQGQSYETFKTTFRIVAGFGEFVAGILTTILAMLIGYAAAWALWWRKRA